MDARFPGLGQPNSGTQIGAQIENAQYTIEFGGTLCLHNDFQLGVTTQQTLASRYTWLPVMFMVKQRLDNFWTRDQFEESLSLVVHNWLSTVSGWGLAYNLLEPTDQSLLGDLLQEVAQQNEPMLNSQLIRRMKIQHENLTGAPPHVQSVQSELMEFAGGTPHYGRTVSGWGLAYTLLEPTEQMLMGDLLQEVAQQNKAMLNLQLIRRMKIRNENLTGAPSTCAQCAD